MPSARTISPYCSGGGGSSSARREERDGDVARAALQRALRCNLERLDDERVAVRDRLLEVHGDLLGLGAGVGEDLRRPAMRGDALRDRHVFVHRGAHHGVRELERHLVVQEVGASERRRRMARKLAIEAGELRGVAKLGASAEHGDSPHEHGRLRG